MLRLDWNMVITIVNLIVLCLLLKKFLIGPVTAIMEQRAALIEQQLADAKNDKQAAGDLKASYEEKLKTSDAESIRIVEESRASARAEYDRIVAEAESKAHGLPIDQVHFHEVGAIDSIVDIISVAVCLHDLGITKVAVSSLAEGKGYVRCQHGVMPVPVPATANIAAAHGLELKLTDNDGEMVTPTGAAIAAALRTEEELPEHYVIEKIGVGAGNKDFKNANILRAMLIRPTEDNRCKPEKNRQDTGENQQNTEEKLWILETNMDDCTGEALGFVMECLMEEGARDVWYTPAYMKKNRPAYVLRILCTDDKREAMEAAVFAHTTTIGIRRWPVERTVLEREVRRVETRYGAADVKVSRNAGVEYFYPEYESVRRICREQGLAFTEVYHALKEDAHE